MLKHYELLEIIKSMVSECAELDRDFDGTPPFIHTDYVQLDNSTILANFVENEDYNFLNNKYKITIEYIHKEHEDYDKIDDF